MIGRTNAGGGGINIKEYAISVAFPVGSECTCTDGVKVLKSKGALAGAWIFPVYPGTWTVTITKDAAHASATVVIDASNKTKHLDMGYRVYVIQGGSVSDGLSAANLAQKVSYNGAPCVRTNNDSTATISNIVVPNYAKTFYVNVKKGRRANSSSYIDIGGVRKTWAADSTNIVEVVKMSVSSIAGRTVTFSMDFNSASNSPTDNKYTYISEAYFE